MVSSIRFSSMQNFLPTINLPVKLAVGSLVISTQFFQTQGRRILNPDRISNIDKSESDLVFYAKIFSAAFTMFGILQYVCLMSCSRRRR